MTFVHLAIAQPFLRLAPAHQVFHYHQCHYNYSDPSEDTSFSVDCNNEKLYNLDCSLEMLDWMMGYNLETLDCNLVMQDCINNVKK